MGTRRVAAVIAIGLAGAGMWWWLQRASPPEREVRQRLHELVSEFNETTTDGLGTATRAARIGQYFEPDVVIELGKGSPPILGRDTVMGMATRLQPRTAAFVASLSDVAVDVVEASRAEATFTLVIRRRGFGSGEETFDAREFSAEWRRNDGAWRIAHVRAIDTFH